MDSTSAHPLPVANVTVSSDQVLWLKSARLALIALAFLLALTTARNSDVWAHLASGRAALTGGANRAAFLPLSWLGDSVMYLLFSLGGGTAVVIAKSVLIAAAAAVMAGASVSWRTILGVLLAILALGAWLPLGPVCASFFLMAVTVRAINGQSPADEKRGWRSVVRSNRWLIAAFVIWANVDPWCLLGLAYLAVYALAGTVIGFVRGGTRQGKPWQSFALACAAVAVSFLPWHLSSAIREFGTTLTAIDFAGSPFRVAALSHILQSKFEGVVPLVAFWLMTGVGVSSFIMARRYSTGDAREQVPQRLIPWLSLFAASFFNVRLVPFFIVVSGVTIALNFRVLSLEIAEQVPRSRSRVERLRVGLQAALGTAAAIVLFAFAWAGWLQLLPFERRNWTVEADPSLVRAATEVDGWYASGLMPKDRATVFFAADAAEAFTWFAPLSLAASQTVEGGPRTVSQVRAAILTRQGTATGGTQLDLNADPRVGCIVVCDANRASAITALGRLILTTDRWKLAHLRGRVAVFVRPDVQIPAVDLAARAFSVESADRSAPGDASQFTAGERWYSPFIEPRPPRSMDRDEAVTYLLLEELTRPVRALDGVHRFLAGLIASLVGNPMPPGGTFNARTYVLADALQSASNTVANAPSFPFERFTAFQILANGSADEYLALRAARRGVVASPRDAAAFELLGEAYLHLLSDPLETTWGKQFPPLRRLRLVQAAAAFRQAVSIDPARPIAHRGLAAVYLENHFLDLALQEILAADRYSHHSQNAADVVDQPKMLEDAVAGARKTTEANSANLSVLDRARLALRNGLAGEALESLLQSDVAIFGNEGLALELDLLLAVGRVADARAWLAPEHRNSLGTLSYNWLAVQSAAGVGDIAAAREILSQQTDSLQSRPVFMTPDEIWRSVQLAANEVLNKRQNAPRMAVALTTSFLSSFAASSGQSLFNAQSRTEGGLLFSILALEEGDIAACLAELDGVQKMWEAIDRGGEPFVSPQRTIARQLASMIH